MTVTVIIPTYRPGDKFQKLMEMLQVQTYPIEKILIMNTEKDFWRDSLLQGAAQAEVYHLTKQEFDHGGTRAAAAEMAQSDILVYFTQDAVPKDAYVLEELLKPFEDPKTAAVYGRQLPEENCRILERYTRSFNYPPMGLRKTKADLKKLGIKTFFCSNVCAAYRKSIYENLEGFVSPVIFNEDMILAGTMIKAGYAVVYAPQASVIHSHNYTLKQQLQRNFDLAVSQADHPEIFAGTSSEKEGLRLVKQTASYLCELRKPWLLLELIASSGAKFLGYQMGKRYQRLPQKMISDFTMNPSYWEKRK